MNGQTDPIGLLAELVARAHPGWELSAVQAALGDPAVMRRPFWQVLAAIGVCYGDPGTKAPGRLAVDGPWWHLASTGTPVPAGFARGCQPALTDAQRAARDEARRAAFAALAAVQADRDLMGVSDPLGTYQPGPAGECRPREGTAMIDYETCAECGETPETATGPERGDLCGSCGFWRAADREKATT